MPSMLPRVIERLPKPFIPLLPAAVTFIVGLLIWTVASFIPVNYLQETSAAYPLESKTAKERVHRPSIRSVAIAGTDQTHHRALQ